MKLLKTTILMSSIITVSLLAGCGIEQPKEKKTLSNPTQVSKQSTNTSLTNKIVAQKSWKISQSNQSNKKQQITENSKWKNKQPKDVIYKLIKPKTCWKLCKLITPKKIETISKVNISTEDIIQPINGIQNAYPILFTNSLTWVAKIVSGLVHKPVNVKQLNAKALKSLWVESDNKWYYIHLWVVAIGKENYCNDGIDNDGDWKIDLADTKDCKDVVVYYDSKAAKVYNKKAIKEYLSTVMPVWFKFSFIDFEKNKKIYYDLLRKTKRDIYLPVFLIQGLPDYYPVYINGLKKQFWQINYLLNTKNKSSLYKYVRLLWQGWDPIKKDIHIKTFSKIGNFTTKELEYYNKHSLLVNPNSNIWLVVWSAGLCPYCKRFMNDLYDTGNINSFASFDLEEFPLPSLHWKTDNDIAVFNSCVADNIHNDKFRLKLIKNEYDNPQIKIDKYFWLLTDKVQKNLIKKCYDTKYKKILSDIQTKDKSDAERFKIKWTPFILMYNKQTGKYWTIPWYIPANMIKQAIKNLETKTNK